ncbi:diguanylate cyclase (GGDEF) domain-containing protein [Burkholderia sp. WP9]|nr:diguanylate cyclase (GGDEF) domain-containing protein [Burkholderia sp. WP9]
MRTQESLCTTLIFCSLFYVTFAVTDVGVLGYTRDTLLLFLYRVLVAMTATAGLYLVRVRPESIVMCRAAATAAEVVGMGVFMIIVRHRPDEIPWHSMSMCIMLIVVYIFIPNRLILSQGIAVFATAAFIAVVIILGTLKRSDILTMSMLLLLTNSFGLVAARRYHRVWREEYRVQSLLTHLTVQDYLTGCYNRRYLNEVLLSAELARSRRHGLAFAVILCDIDHFKAINDTYGHLCGDAIIRNFATLLRKSTRQHVDSVVRYGGEEFLLLLPQTDRAGAAILAERLRHSFAEASVEYREQRIVATASFGVLALSFADGGGDVSEEAIIAAADSLLYRAKKAGRNNVQSDDLFN